MDEIAVRVDNVSKDFKLPHEKVDSIKNVFVHLIKYLLKHRSYEVQHALRDVSLEVKKGEFFGIVGRNGSGKSTLLKIIAGIYQPTKGSIQVAGKLVPFIELGVGFNPELTGRENVYLNGALLGFSKKEVDRQYDGIVEFAELEKFMDQKLKNYSSGMHVRLAFSMAIRAEADVLLVDEVLAVGDNDFQRKCFDYFKSLKRNKKTVIFVSHSMDAVREYCDRAVMVEDSKIVASGTAEKVAMSYTKMFLEDRMKLSSDGQDTTSRWGDNSVIFTNPKIERIDEDEVSFSMVAECKVNCDDPQFGFILVNAIGTQLLGTNNTLNRLKSSPMKAGQKRKITWGFNNILSEGSYTLTIAALHDGGVTPADWWEEAISFNVRKQIRTPYGVQPSYSLEIKELS